MIFSTRKLFNTSLTCAGIAAVACLQASPSYAVVVDATYTADVFSGPFSGSYDGTFSYENEFIPDFGEFSISPEEGSLISFTLDFFGQTFEASDDIDFDAFPQINFLDGVPVAFDFIIDELNLDNPTDIDVPGVTTLSLVSSLSEIEPNVFETELFINGADNIPTPALLPAALGMGLAQLRKRKLAQSEEA